MKRIASAAAAAFALISCHSTQTEAATKVRPALWKVQDADTTVYLFGTIHLLPKALAWQSPRIDKALNASSDLVLETVLDKDPQKTGAIMAQIGLSPGLPPIVDRVPAAKRATLETLVRRSGIPTATLDRFETWAVALTLASTGLRALPVSPDYGAEAVLTKRFEAAHKPISGLETPAQQLGYFDALPETAQRVFLESVVDDDSNASAEFDKMIAAWTAGDVNKIALTFDDELKLSPELTDALLKRRNANWVDWIARRMDTPGTTFVAVGAGHLAGAGSVADLLSKRGFRVSRVQ